MPVRAWNELSGNGQLEQDQVERVLAPLMILEFDRAAALRYSAIKADQIRWGRPIGDVDALIAAVAMANAQILLTRNPRHFAQIPVLVVEAY